MDSVTIVPKIEEKKRIRRDKDVIGKYDKVLEALVRSDLHTTIPELTKELVVSKSTIANYSKQIDKSKK